MHNNLEWNFEPGCFESYLYKVFVNPLIEIEYRSKVSEILNNFKLVDSNEYVEFSSKLLRLYELIPSNLSDQAIVDITRLLEIVDDLIGTAYRSGGRCLTHLNNLEYLRATFIETYQIIYANNESMLEILQNAESYHNSVSYMYNDTFVMQSSRADTPYNTYLFEILLFEDSKSVEKFMLTMANDKVSLPIIKNEITKLIIKAYQNNIFIPHIKDKLQHFMINNENLKNLLKDYVVVKLNVPDKR